MAINTKPRTQKIINPDQIAPFRIIKSAHDCFVEMEACCVCRASFGLVDRVEKSRRRRKDFAVLCGRRMRASILAGCRPRSSTGSEEGSLVRDAVIFKVGQASRLFKRARRSFYGRQKKMPSRGGTFFQPLDKLRLHHQPSADKENRASECCNQTQRSRLRNYAYIKGRIASDDIIHRNGRCAIRLVQRKG